MSKRITLTDFEIEQLVSSLKSSQREARSLSYAIVVFGQDACQRLIDKLQPPSKEEGKE